MQNAKNPVVDNIPDGWLPEQQALAREAATLLIRHYPGYAWGIEWTKIVGKDTNSAMILRLTDVPTDVCYIIQLADLRNEGTVMRAGGEFLEALGLPRTKWRHEEVRGLKRTPAGLIVPSHAAIPENNPGYEKVKAAEATVR